MKLESILFYRHQGFCGNFISVTAIIIFSVITSIFAQKRLIVCAVPIYKESSSPAKYHTCSCCMQGVLNSHVVQFYELINVNEYVNQK